MKALILLALLAVFAGVPSRRADRGPRAFTFSIVARDPATGEMGVAVQSHWFSVGSVVPWARAGVGAVATQSFVDPSYGPLGLDLMRAGRTAPEALKALRNGDPHPEVRQVAMIDARGNVANFTGDKCIQEAGGVVDEAHQFACQANLMRSNKVWPAMAKAYLGAGGDLAERLLAALEAAQNAGGDIRGMQSAAILVVKGTSTGRPWSDKVFDLRVEDSPHPLKDLTRLVRLQRAYNHAAKGDDLVSEHKVDKALQEYAKAADLAPGVLELQYWEAVALASSGRLDEALPIFKKVFSKEHRWVTLTPRLVQAGQLPDDPGMLKRILAQAPGRR